MNYIYYSDYADSNRIDIEFDKIIYEKDILKHFELSEVDLYDKKWFDYRFIHPLKATCMYYHFFKLMNSIYIRRYIDLEASQKPISKNGVFNMSKSAIYPLIKGRQLADANCIPYGFFINFAFKYCMEECNSSVLPNSSMFCTPNCLRYINEKWFEHNCYVFQTANLDFYEVRNYCGHPYQDDYQNYLHSMINITGKRKSLQNYLFDDKKHLLKMEI